MYTKRTIADGSIITRSNPAPIRIIYHHRYLTQMAFQLVEYNTQSISLEDVQNRYPDGYHSTAHGCYYFADMDGDVAYYIQNADNSFEDEVQYVDLDLLSDGERAAVLYELENLR